MPEITIESSLHCSPLNGGEGVEPALSVPLVDILDSPENELTRRIVHVRSQHGPS